MKSSIGQEAPEGQGQDLDEAAHDFAHDGEPASPGAGPRDPSPARTHEKDDAGLASTQEPGETVLPPPPN